MGARTFQQIADTRFGEGLLLLLERVERIKRGLALLPVSVSVSSPDQIEGRGFHQWRVTFRVEKNGRGCTWADVYAIVNAAQPVPYDKA